MGNSTLGEKVFPSSIATTSATKTCKKGSSRWQKDDLDGINIHDYLEEAPDGIRGLEG
ncbi:Hypothetical predicted protein [Lynx pardinus]|uniref:Uncharacterized protein n=1 Tax=Lynx pardinus TaxID=191816 RepID=A0A485P8L5_LYNPA|nr:Hypothetical predicted protein [Lynx pardinus]